MKRKPSGKAGAGAGGHGRGAKGKGGGRRAGPPGARGKRSKSPRGQGASSARSGKPDARETEDAASGTKERLQKVLAAAGLGSRRQCEELIVSGRVEIDRRVVVELGTRVDPLSQKIRVDGVEISKRRTVWYAVNKPTGVVCTNRDPSGRVRAIDLVPEARERLFPVGRLDLNSEGLLLLTNDGDLANRLTHPRYGVLKTYRVMVAGHPSRETLAQLQRGVYLAEGLARIGKVRVKRRYKQSAILEMELREGRNREIRRIFARVGHKVMKLVRIATGPIQLGDLEPGGYRRLTGAEIDTLRRCARGGKQ